MGFLKRIKDVASGRVSKINYLFGNHAIRILGKLDNNSNRLLFCIVKNTSICTIEFLEFLLYDVKDFKYDDGTLEFNPFKQNINLLNKENSILMFNLVVSNYIANLFSIDMPEDLEKMLPDIRAQLFTIFGFNEEDKEIFIELYTLSRNNEKPSSEFRLYEYIFKNVYQIEIPQLAYHMMNFEITFKALFKESFMPRILNFLDG
jgi:hypothetical protein